MSKVRQFRRSAERAAAKESELTVTVADLLNSTEPLRTLAQQPMPSRLTFQLVKIIRAVTKELEAVDETRLKLCQQYGKLNEKTNEYEFAKAKAAAFQKEFGEFAASTEVVIKGTRLDLDGLPGLMVSASDIILLSWLIE